MERMHAGTEGKRTPTLIEMDFSQIEEEWLARNAGLVSHWWEPETEAQELREMLKGEGWDEESTEEFLQEGKNGVWMITYLHGGVAGWGADLATAWKSAQDDMRGQEDERWYEDEDSEYRQIQEDAVQFHMGRSLLLPAGVTQTEAGPLVHLSIGG